MKYRINAVKTWVGMLTGLAFLIISVTAVTQRYFLLALLTGALPLVYLYAALRNGKVLVLGESGVQVLSLGRQVESLSWGDVKEYGIVSSRVFGTEKAIKNGTKYVYFSRQKMDDDQRFKMCLNWPPRDCVYALYKRELFHDTKLRLAIEPTYFNTDEP